MTNLSTKKISYVMITNGQRAQTIELSIKSISKNIRKDIDELIIVGNIDNIKFNEPFIKLIDEKKAAMNGEVSYLRNTGVKNTKNDIIVNLDDDILLPTSFTDKLLSYNKFDGSLTTKMFLINGGRYWDRPCYDNGITFNIDYDSNSPNLFYTSCLIIRSREVCEKFPFDEKLKYYEAEDVEVSFRMTKNGHTINIDTNNHVFHVDDSYLNIIDDRNNNALIKQQHLTPSHYVIKDNTMAKECIMLIKELMK
jgi:glycosyltransferase involved in cell wall biosynthesis